MNWIIVDLDGTLCNCSHRVHWATAKEWDKFHSGIPEDESNFEVEVILRHLAPHYSILVCTGRDERHRIATEKWLREKKLDGVVDAMLMRPENNRTQDGELKVTLIEEFFGGREKTLASVLMVLEDRDRVVEALRDYGLKVWQVTAGEY